MSGRLLLPNGTLAGPNRRPNQGPQRHLALVARNRELVKLGSLLTDGECNYKVEDTQRRGGVEDWVFLRNQEHPERCGWYRVADCDNLGLDLRAQPDE